MGGEVAAVIIARRPAAKKNGLQFHMAGFVQQTVNKAGQKGRNSFR